jgi:hypothetical protein
MVFILEEVEVDWTLQSSRLGAVASLQAISLDLWRRHEDHDIVSVWYSLQFNDTLRGN